MLLGTNSTNITDQVVAALAEKSRCDHGFASLMRSVVEGKATDAEFFTYVNLQSAAISEIGRGQKAVGELTTTNITAAGFRPAPSSEPYQARPSATNAKSAPLYGPRLSDHGDDKCAFAPGGSWCCVPERACFEDNDSDTTFGTGQQV